MFVRQYTDPRRDFPEERVDIELFLEWFPGPAQTRDGHDHGAFEQGQLLGDLGIVEQRRPLDQTSDDRLSFGRSRGFRRDPCFPRRRRHRARYLTPGTGGLFVLAERLLERSEWAALVHVVAPDPHAVEIEARRHRMVGVREELHPHDRVLLVADHLADALDPLHALEDVGLDERTVELHLDEGLGHPACTRDEILDRVHALRARELVRIDAVRQRGHARVHARRAERLARDADGLLPGGVAIEQEYDARREALQQLRLLLGERRAERRDDVLETARVQRDDVEVALDEDRGLLLADRMARLVDAEEHLALRVDRALGRVDVLGRRLALTHVPQRRPRRGSVVRRRRLGQLAERTPAERDDAALRVHHREHQSMTEAIVEPRPARARHEQADGLGRRRRHPLLAEERRQPVPPRRRIADAEGLEDLVDLLVLPDLQSALRELLERVRTVVVPTELVFEVRRRERVDAIELLARLLLTIGLRQRRVVAARLLDLDPRAFGEGTHRFRKRVSLMFDQEVDCAPRFFAAEAVEEAAVRVHVEARRLLLVERTQAHERAPAALQRRYCLLDDRKDVRPFTNERDRLLGDHSDLGARVPCRLNVRSFGRLSGARGEMSQRRRIETDRRTPVAGQAERTPVFSEVPASFPRVSPHVFGMSLARSLRASSRVSRRDFCSDGFPVSPGCHGRLWPATHPTASTHGRREPLEGATWLDPALPRERQAPQAKEPRLFARKHRLRSMLGKDAGTV